MINVSGADELSSRLSNIAGLKWFDSFQRELAQFIFDDVEAGYGKHSKSGMLERSLGAGPYLEGERTYVIRSDGQIAPHNVFMEWGTRAHDILPRDRKSLRWVSGNRFVFAKRVRHPGTPGDPVFTNAAENGLREFESMIKKYTQEL